MSLWVDKYRPRELSKLDYHVEQANDLKRLCEQQDFPHLMFFGPSGAGKKTRIMCILRELYGTSAERLRNETMQFTTPSNKKVEIMTVSSNYHIEGKQISHFFSDHFNLRDFLLQWIHRMPEFMIASSSQTSSSKSLKPMSSMQTVSATSEWLFCRRLMSWRKMHNTHWDERWRNTLRHVGWSFA